MKEILKKNILSVLCGVVILLAIIALFWPIGGMKLAAQEQAEERLAVHAKLKGLAEKSRKWPIVSLDTNAPDVPLTQFPGPKVIEAGTIATKAMAEQSSNMLGAAVAMNQHALLVPDSLPTPTDRQKFDFRNAYRKAIKETIPTDILHSAVPPSEKDLADAEKKLWETKYVTLLVKQIDVDPQTKVETVRWLNEKEIAEQFGAEADKLPEKIRKDRAEQSQMYLNEDAIVSSMTIMGEGPQPTADQMWYAQNALWVMEDVCHSIARLNSIAKNTLDSPVKRLVRLNVDPNGPAQYVMPDAVAAATPDAPAPVADPNAPIEKKYSRSPTGRVSNALYDVITFEMEVHVDARKVTQLLTELSREKFFVPAPYVKLPHSFITVNKLDMGTVNKTEALREGFQYGEAPVVKLGLQCEALLLRRWTTPFMPDEVKKQLGIETKAAEGKTTAAAAQ